LSKTAFNLIKNSAASLREIDSFSVNLQS